MVWLDHASLGRVGMTDHAVRRFSQRFPARKLEVCFPRAVELTASQADAAARADKRRVKVSGDERYAADLISAAVWVLVKKGERLQAVTVLRLPGVRPRRGVIH